MALSIGIFKNIVFESQTGQQNGNNKRTKYQIVELQDSFTFIFILNYDVILAITLAISAHF
jgi:hypothetical protein